MAFAGADKLLLVSTDTVGQRLAGHRAAIDAARAAGVSLVAYTSITLAELAARLSAASSREITYTDMPAQRFAELLTAVGLPKDYAEILADADQGLGRGELFTDSGDLRRLIGRPTTTPSEAITTALRQS